MRHQCHLAKPPRTLVGIEHLAQHFLAARGRGLDDTPFLEADRDVVDQRALIGQWLGGDDMTVDLPAMRRGEDFLSRDIGIADDAVPGDRRAAHPFVAVGKPDHQVRTRSGIMQRLEALSVEPCGPLAQHGVVLFPCGHGAIAIHARSREDGIRQPCHRDVVGVIGKHPLRPRQARIGDDVPVGVEIDDFLQRRLIGDRIGLAGARDLGGVLTRQQHRIVADNGKPRGVG